MYVLITPLWTDTTQSLVPALWNVCPGSHSTQNSLYKNIKNAPIYMSQT